MKRSFIDFVLYLKHKAKSLNGSLTNNILLYYDEAVTYEQKIERVLKVALP